MLQLEKNAIYALLLKVINLTLDSMSHVLKKTRLCHMRTRKGTNQPSHPRSLISAFIVRCLDSITLILSKSKHSRL